MKEKLTVIKVGGKIVEDETSLKALLEEFRKIEGHKVLVHGGGRTATNLASQMGIATQMVNGRRVTDKAMLDIVTMVYGGLVNKNVVAKLQALGINALGLTGADMDVIRSHKRPVKEVDYGFVGDVESAKGELLSHFIKSGVVPVMAPLTHDGKGTLLNTNADTIASTTAKALAPYYDVTLTFCFEKKGVLSNPDDDDSVIPHISCDDYSKLVENGTISGGMMPKIQNSIEAIEAGVARVCITRADDIASPSGTIID